MAFVFEGQRQLNPLSKLANPTGPGQYFAAEGTEPHHSSAPFHSSSKRKTVFAPKGKQMPGPGDYEVSRPIIEPNIKSVSNSHSIILKINSTGTSQFKSTNARFRGDDTPVPGPGNYQYDVFGSQSRERKVHSFREEKGALKKMRQMSRSFYEKNVPAIPDKYRGLTDTKKEEEIPETQRLGPACYNPNKTVHVNSTGSVWGKDKTKRFIPDKNNSLGPGQYKADYKPSRPDEKAGLSAGHFRSATARSYFDAMIYRSNVDSTVQERAKGIFKSKDPAPGQYNYNSSSFAIRDKPFSFQFFGSTVERFTEEQPDNQKAKKNTFYNLKSDFGKTRSFNRGNHGFNSLTERNNEFLDMSNQKVPGPGHYKEKVTIEKKLKGVKVQKFGSTTDRPFHGADKVDELGPGKYQKNDSVEQFLQTRFGQINHQNSTFKSSTARKCFGEEKRDDKIFGQYDVSYHDMAKKLERQKMFLENLKKIEVSKPGFESSYSRFPHYEARKDSPIKDKEKRMEFNREQQLKFKQQNERARSVIIDSNRSQLNEKKNNGLFDKQERFSSFKRGTPGAGAYGTQDGWHKKSHNVKYKK